MVDGLQAFLQGRLLKEPREDIMDYMRFQGLFNLDDKEALLEEYKRLDHYFPGAERPAAIEIPGDARTAALSRIMAIDAARRPDVKKFRHEFLGRACIDESEVSGWVEQMVRTSQDSMHKKSATKGQRRPASLEYLVGPDQRIASVPVVPGSPVAKLKKLAGALENSYRGWRDQEAHVVQFILTGTPPSIWLGDFRVEPAAPFRAQSRVVITVDPRVSPKVLAENYSEARRPLQGKDSPRDKPISDKHLELGVLAEQKREVGGPGWEELLESWNSHFPRWKYEGKNAHIIFARDSRRAWSRVTGDPWPSR
jgi:hypothetical protein